MMLRRAGKGYVLGVHANHWFNSWSTDIAVAREARDIAAALPTDAWTRLSAGHGTKGERLYDWSYCPLADLDAADQDALTPGLWTRGLLIRRPPGEGDLAYFTTWCPNGTSIDTMVRVEGTRWRIEEGFETATTEFGLDHNETRSWHGWHRHVSPVMLAYAMMAAVRHQANTLPTPKNTRAATPPLRLIRWSIQEIRRLALKLAQRSVPIAHALRWSHFWRAHQAAAQQAHLIQNTQL